MSNEDSMLPYITLAYVASVNGKLTRGDDPNVNTWSSDEDWQHFTQLRSENDVVILDRKSYETVQPKPESGRLRVVFTTTPERFKTETVPGQLEFTSQSPREVVRNLARAGHRKVLLAGGARLSSTFLAAGLVHELDVTFEPLLFASGRPMFETDFVDISLQLLSITQLNDRGTLLAQYRVLGRLA